MTTPPHDHSLLQERLRRQVEERRRRGEYPPGLEEQLDRHYLQILRGFDRQTGPLADIHSSLERLRHLSVVDPGRIETWSRNPLKRFLHRLIGKLTIRQTRGVLAQMQDHYSALDDMLSAVVDHLAASEDTGHISHLPQATGRASLDSDRRLAAALDRLSGCEDRLARLEAIRDNPTA